MRVALVTEGETLRESETGAHASGTDVWLLAQERRGMTRSFSTGNAVWDDIFPAMPSFTANFQTLLIMTGRVRLYSSITFL
jgi:hypothetical protein